MEFPRLVYKGPELYKLVQDEVEHAEALAEGWFSGVLEAAEARLGSVGTATMENAPKTAPSGWAKGKKG